MLIREQFTFNLINNEIGCKESFQLKEVHKFFKSASKLKNFISTFRSEELEAAIFYSLGIGFYGDCEVCVWEEC